MAPETLIASPTDPTSTEDGVHKEPEGLYNVPLWEEGCWLSLVRGALGVVVALHYGLATYVVCSRVGEIPPQLVDADTPEAFRKLAAWSAANAIAVVSLMGFAVLPMKALSRFMLSARTRFVLDNTIRNPSDLAGIERGEALDHYGGPGGASKTLKEVGASPWEPWSALPFFLLSAWGLVIFGLFFACELPDPLFKQEEALEAALISKALASAGILALALDAGRLGTEFLRPSLAHEAMLAAGSPTRCDVARLTRCR